MMPGFYTNVAALAGGGSSPPASGPTWDATAHADGATLSADKLTASGAGSGDIPGLATVPITAGEKIWVEAVATTTGSHIALGLGNADILLVANWLGGDANSMGIYSDNQIWIAGSQSDDTSISYAEGSILNLAVDRSTGVETVQLYVGGVAQGSAFAHGLTGDLFPAYDVHDANTAITLVQPGSYTNPAPTGFTEYGAS